METATVASPSAFRRALIEWWQSEGVLWVFVFKALLSVFVALWLAYRLELPQPSTVIATVFIVLQRQSGDVLAKSFYRIIGTMVGLTVTVTLIALFNQERVLFLLFLSVWLGFCVAGSARFRDFRGYACVLAGYTAVMIGVPATLQPDNAFMNALWRVIEIVVGILCAGLVSGLILPLTSSSNMRATQYNRFRDFIGFAMDGLNGKLDLTQVEQINARFAALAVGLENLRSASAFEDPRIRLRQGRLARLNNEFMVLSTRFHALHRLLQRLQDDNEEDVLEALQPCLDEAVLILEPLRGHLLVDAEAAQQAERLDSSKQELMQRIRLARQQLAIKLPDEAQSLDFDTAAELLFRFADDLHGYLLTQASLISTHHEREQWKDNFTPRSNGLAAVISGMRCALLVLLISSFWIATAWSSGSTAVLTVGLVSGLISMTSRPGPFATQILIGAFGSGAVGFFLYFWVYPVIDGFAILFCVLGPVLAFGAFLLVRPVTAGYGVGWLVWFCILSLPVDLTQYDPSHFLNEWIASLIAIGAAAVAASFILPPNRPWLWRGLEQDLRMRLVFAVTAKLKGLVAGFESSTRDLLNQAYIQAAGHPDMQRHLMHWMFAVLEVGHAVIELRQEQAALPREPWYAKSTEWRACVRIMEQALVDLFMQVDEDNRQRALIAVEQAIEAVRNTPEPRPPQFDTSPLRRVLSHLHFIRTSLLDPHSPLAKTSSVVIESASLATAT